MTSSASGSRSSRKETLGEPEVTRRARHDSTWVSRRNCSRASSNAPRWKSRRARLTRAATNAGVDLERLAIVLLGMRARRRGGRPARRARDAVRGNPDSGRAPSRSACCDAFEVAATQLDVPEVHPGLGEAAGCTRSRARASPPRWRDRSPARAAAPSRFSSSAFGGKRRAPTRSQTIAEQKRNDDEATRRRPREDERPHGHPIGHSSASCAKCGSPIAHKEPG